MINKGPIDRLLPPSADRGCTKEQLRTQLTDTYSRFRRMIPVGSGILVLAVFTDGFLGAALLGPFNLTSAASGGPVMISPRAGHWQHKLGELMDRDVRANRVRDLT